MYYVEVKSNGKFRLYSVAHDGREVEWGEYLTFEAAIKAVGEFSGGRVVIPLQPQA